MYLGGCTWKAGTNAYIEATGMTHKVINAGEVQWRLYELGAQHFVAGGYSDYFECNNKGCDTSSPIALTLQDPTAASTNFTMRFNFTMPARNPNATNNFELYAYGIDQDHYPYDFNLQVGYKYSTAPPSVRFGY